MEFEKYLLKVNENEGSQEKDLLSPLYSEKPFFNPTIRRESTVNIRPGINVEHPICKDETGRNPQKGFESPFGASQDHPLVMPPSYT